jgi:hypothetical protein
LCGRWPTITQIFGATGPTQEQLENAIGDETTLMPDDPPRHVYTCWNDPPANLGALLPDPEDERAHYRVKWLCSPDIPRRSTGTPCPHHLRRDECRAWAMERGLIEPD